ncbi:MAG: hypothetical protein B6244_09450 [Candidatus Cloacimonetes bacterium 4572_55]|nr:MAG: hypothetical protein B6244_09450 [Candidatus Cloacimonetes bacterium 4572_55]
MDSFFNYQFLICENLRNLRIDFRGQLKQSEIRDLYGNVYETFLIKPCNYARLMYKLELLYARQK